MLALKRRKNQIETLDRLVDKSQCFRYFVSCTRHKACRLLKGIEMLFFHYCSEFRVIAKRNCLDNSKPERRICFFTKDSEESLNWRLYHQILTTAWEKKIMSFQECQSKSCTLFYFRQPGKKQKMKKIMYFII